MNNTMTLRGSDSPARDTRTGARAPRKTARAACSKSACPTARAGCSATGEHGVTLQVHDEAMFSQVLARGDIGLAEAYLDGHWDSPDVTGLLTLLTRNRDVLKKAVLRFVAQPAGSARAPLAEPQQPDRQQAQHHGPLRSRQRLLPAVARPEHELFGRHLPRRPTAATWKRRSAPSTGASCAACTPTRGKACSRSAAAGAASPRWRSRKDCRSPA